MSRFPARLPSYLLISLLLGLVVFGAIIALPNEYVDVQLYGLWDLGSFWASGHLWLAGANPYARSYSIPNSPAYMFPNLNPPISLFAFVPLARLDPLFAYRAHWLISLLAYGLCLVALFRLYPGQSPVRRLWPLALPGFWLSLRFGQIYVWLLALLILTLWLQRRGHPNLAGLTLGLLVAVKPNFAMVPAYLLLAGFRPTALVGLASAAVLSLLPLPVFGPDVYPQYLAAALHFDSNMPQEWVLNASLPGAAVRFGLPALGLLLGVLLCFLVAWRVWRLRPGFGPTSALAIAIGLLASPVAWLGYSLLLVPAFLEPRRWSPVTLTAATLLATPIQLWERVAPLSGLLAPLVSSAYTLGLLLIVVGLLCTQPRISHSPSPKAPSMPSISIDRSAQQGLD